MPDKQVLKQVSDFFSLLGKKIITPSPLLCEKSFRPFAKQLAKTLQTKPISPVSIAKIFFDAQHKFHATHIYIEPAEIGIQILFRIDGVLKRGALLKKKEGEQLCYMLKNYPEKLTPGQYGVLEGKVSEKFAASQEDTTFYFIPRDGKESITITSLSSSPPVTKTTPKSGKQAIPNFRKKIFIWQMGKVGSLSIYNSLKKHSTPTNWQPLTLFPDNRWPTHNNLIQTHSVELLYNTLHYSDEEFVIISLVRDLLARNISSIFQSMNFQEDWRNEYFIATKKDFQKLPYEVQEKELTRQLKKLNFSDSPKNWYDNLLRSHLYYPDIDKYFIDVYAKPFDQERGYQIYESRTPRVKLLIIRLEDLDTLEKEIGSFLGTTDFHLIKTNISVEKWYQPVYQKFKEKYKPSPDELEKIYNSKFMTYFYSAKQIKQFKGHWTR